MEVQCSNWSSSSASRDHSRGQLALGGEASLARLSCATLLVRGLAGHGLELAKNAERAKFWSDVARDLRGEPVDLSAYAEPPHSVDLSPEPSTPEEEPPADQPPEDGPSDEQPPGDKPPPPRVKLF